MNKKKKKRTLHDLVINVCYLNSFSSVQFIYITKEYLVYRITYVKWQYLKPFNHVKTKDSIEELVLHENN